MLLPCECCSLVVPALMGKMQSSRFMSFEIICILLSMRDNQETACSACSVHILRSTFQSGSLIRRLFFFYAAMTSMLLKLDSMHCRVLLSLFCRWPMWR